MPRTKKEPEQPSQEEREKEIMTDSLMAVQKFTRRIMVSSKPGC
jgi:hypothetical protein